jgi:hypothetical protein
MLICLYTSHCRKEMEQQILYQHVPGLRIRTYIHCDSDCHPSHIYTRNSIPVGIIHDYIKWAIAWHIVKHIHHFGMYIYLLCGEASNLSMWLPCSP